MKWNASHIWRFILLFRWTDAPPGRSCLHFFRIACRKKNMKLMRFETLRCGAVFRPKSKGSRRKAFLHKPESLTIIRQALYSGFPAISKNKQTAGKRIFLQHRFADSSESIDAIPEIDRFHSHQDSHLRRNLYQRSPLQNALLRAFRSTAFMPLLWIRILSPF
jgi:hypothetical protein